MSLYSTAQHQILHMRYGHVKRGPWADPAAGQRSGLRSVPSRIIRPLWVCVVSSVVLEALLTAQVLLS